MTISNKAEAIASIQGGALQVQAGLLWLEANDTGTDYTRLHRRASLLGLDAEDATGAVAGSISNPGGVIPADGTPKT